MLRSYLNNLIAKQASILSTLAGEAADHELKRLSAQTTAASSGAGDNEQGAKEADAAAAAASPQSQDGNGADKKASTSAAAAGASSSSSSAAANAIAGAEAAEAMEAAAAAAAAAAKARAKRREQWALTNGVLRRETRPQRLDRHDFVFFVSNRNAEEYPCVVVKTPQPAQSAAEAAAEEEEEEDDDDEEGGADGKKGTKKKKKKKTKDKKDKKPAQPKDKNPTLYEVLYYDRDKENPLELGWEAIARDSFVPPPPIYVPVWDAAREQALDAEQAGAAAAVQRHFRGFSAKTRHRRFVVSARALQGFMRFKVQAWVKRRRAEEFARQPVAYRLLVVDEDLESLLELKSRAVHQENFDQAHALKLETERKRREKERYVRTWYTTRAVVNTTTNTCGWLAGWLGAFSSYCQQCKSA